MFENFLCVLLFTSHYLAPPGFTTGSSIWKDMFRFFMVRSCLLILPLFMLYCSNTVFENRLKCPTILGLLFVSLTWQVFDFLLQFVQFYKYVLRRNIQIKKWQQTQQTSFCCLIFFSLPCWHCSVFLRKCLTC